MQVRAAQASACGKLLCDDCKAKGAAICASLRPHELPVLSEIASHKRMEPGQSLFHEDDRAAEVFTLTEGTLKLFKLMADGRRQITGFVLPGDFIGLAYQKSYAYTAEAITPATVCRFARPQFQQVVGEHPALERELLSRASAELVAAQDQMLLLGRKTARERLASFVLRLAERHRIQGERPIPLPMGRADIGDYIGLTIETVSRTFTALKNDGLIGLPDKHHVTILDHQGLVDASGR